MTSTGTGIVVRVSWLQLANKLSHLTCSTCSSHPESVLTLKAEVRTQSAEVMRRKLKGEDYPYYRPCTAFRLKKYRNYRQIIAKIQATFLQNKGYFKKNLNEFK